MKIAIDNIDVKIFDNYVDLSKYHKDTEKYVHAVDNRIDFLFTDNEETAKFFTENGIIAFIVYKN